MKSFSLILGSIFLLNLTLFSSANGAECMGQWQRIPNYKRSMGAGCQYLGLDTHRGTCQPGDTYETLCDDAPEGLYRTCPGPRRCADDMPRNNECRQWDFVNNLPCPPGYVNFDCEGYCEQQTHRGQNDCQGWDFAYDRPCPRGYLNQDCQGGCEPASFFGR